MAQFRKGERVSDDLIPTITELANEAARLIKRLIALRSEHLPSDDTAGSQFLPIRYPLGLRWRPLVGDATDRPRVMAKVMSWAREFRLHMMRVDRYFLEVHEKLDFHKRFFFRSYEERYHEFESLGIDDCLIYLEHDEDRLAIEAYKLNEIVPRTLPAMLKTRRLKFDMTQDQAAEYFDVTVDAFKAWERGRYFPAGANMRRMREFVSLESAPPIQKRPSRRRTKAV